MKEKNRDMELIIYDGNLSSTSHAKSVDGNIEHCHIEIKRFGGYIYTLYEGDKFDWDNWKEKMKRQGRRDY